MRAERRWSEQSEQNDQHQQKQQLAKRSSISGRGLDEATHLHRGRVAPVGSSEPAVGGALVDVHILEANVHTHHAATGQEDSVTERETAPRHTVLGQFIVKPNTADL